MFLDANIFIKAFLSPNQGEGKLCKQLLDRIARGETNAKTSVLVLNEILYFFEKNFDKKRALKTFNNLCSFPNLEILAVEKRTMASVSEYSNAGLDASDAFHAAVMKSNGIDTICSYDKGFDKVKGLKRQEPK